MQMQKETIQFYYNNTWQKAFKSSSPYIWLPQTLAMTKLKHLYRTQTISHADLYHWEEVTENNKEQ